MADDNSGGIFAAEIRLNQLGRQLADARWSLFDLETRAAELKYSTVRSCLAELAGQLMATGKASSPQHAAELAADLYRRSAESVAKDRQKTAS